MDASYFGKKPLGFTLVELLIVIVVIGILAAITLVAYNGVQAKAQLSAAMSAVRQSRVKVETFKVDNSTYPNSITDCPTPAVTNICLSGDYYYVAQTINSVPYYQLASEQDSQFYYYSNLEKTSTNEFLAYADLAPFIDKYGADKDYKLTFSIKSGVAGNMQVYMQNGSGAKYTFTASVPVTTSYTTQTIVVKPTVWQGSLTASYLAFYGTYGSGKIPTVKDVKFQLN